MSRATPGRPTRACHRFVQGTQGAVAVEFALVFSVLIVLVFGVFEVGRAIHYRNAVEVLTDRAARTAILSADCAVSADALSDLRDNAFGLTGDAFTFTPATDANGYVFGAIYAFDLIVPVFGERSVTLSATRDLSLFCSPP